MEFAGFFKGLDLVDACITQFLQGFDPLLGNANGLVFLRLAHGRGLGRGLRFHLRET